jgi:branched-subunit amino acid aminotransferase/4-amino-4-deoxychorismate lyase
MMVNCIINNYWFEMPHQSYHQGAMNESINRAFMYGESVFTTMRLVDGRARDWEFHFDRLKKSAEFVYGPFIEGEHWHTFLRDRLETRLDAEEGDKVMRLTLYREHERGLHLHGLISVMDLRLHVDISPYDPLKYEGKRFQLRSVRMPSRPAWWPSYLKTGNYLETILIQKKNLGPEDDDVLFISNDDTVLETSIANVFVMKDGKLFTPPVGPHVLDGIMRRRVLEAAPGTFTSIQESEISLKEIFKAEGVFGTNSLRGLFLVSRIDDHEIGTSQGFLEAIEKLKRTLKL